MDADSSTKERERAFEAFNAILHAYTAALQAVGVLATLPNGQQLVFAQIKLRSGMRDGFEGADLEEAADNFIDMARAERERDFETLRRVTLVSLCGALEYLIKAVIVDQAAYDIGKATKLLIKKNVKLSASEVMGLTPTEQWFTVADRLYDALSESDPLMYPRAVRLLNEFTFLPFGKDQQSHIDTILNADESRLLNEAFLVRNCLVHNGGRVSSALSRFSGLKRSDLIELDRRYGSSLLKTIRKFAIGLNSVWLAGAL